MVASLAVSVPSRPKVVSNAFGSLKAPSASNSGASQPRFLVGLEVGLAGPPIVGSDGGWWLLGTDGEIERFRADDSLLWSISLATTISGPAAADNLGLLFVPTARDLVYALEPSGHPRWRFRAPAGIVGAVSWVPEQGSVFVGRDRAVYWLDRRANLMLRAPVHSRVTAGPTPVGANVVVGTEEGQLLVLTRQGKRHAAQLGGAVAAILTTRDGVIAFAGGKAYGLNAEAQVLWLRGGVLGIGVTAALGNGQRESLAAILLASGQMEWLDFTGKTQALTPLMQTVPSDLVPEFVATERCAWISSDSGLLWVACVGKGARPIALSRAPLTRPIIDIKGARAMVGSVAGGVWSLPLAPDT